MFGVDALMKDKLPSLGTLSSWMRGYAPEAEERSKGRMRCVWHEVFDGSG